MTTPGIANLRTVSSSKPQLLHSESQQSIAVSDDYYSFSDHVSSQSSGSKVTVVRYATPQSRGQSREPSPNLSRIDQETEMALPERRVGETGESENVPPGTASTVRFGESQVTRISPRPESTRRQNNNNGAPTPGVDDTPYIRFAIEQLTRDEEVAGTGRQTSVASSDYPVERIIGDEGLGYFSRSSGPSKELPKRSLERPPAPHSEESDVGDLFVAADPPEDYRYPYLDYVPVVLRPLALAVAIFCCLLMIAGVAFCNAWSQRHNGLWDYDGLGGSRYFVFQFLPQLLAILLIVWMFVVQAAVYRTIPFSIMASERQLDCVLQNLPILPRNFLLPDLSHFKHGEMLVGFSLLMIWLTNLFAIPLQSCFFQTKYFDIDGQGIWRWTSTEAVGWTLVVVYALLIIALVLLMFRYCQSWTGLMWDPVSLADLIPLIQRSNVLHDFERSETALAIGDFVTPRTLRLGYWRTSDEIDIFYGIGEEHAPIRSPSLHQSSKSREKQPDLSTTEPIDLEQQRITSNDTFERNLHSPSTRYRWTVWFLRDTYVVSWMVVVFILFIAFVLVSFINRAVQGGFVPRLPTLASADGFSSSNFLYSFIPALIGTVLFLVWQPIDIYFRALQPFVDLSFPEGAAAEDSLLLSYVSCFPFEVTLLALLAKHYKVAWVSFMSIASLTIPVLSGGIFTALWYPSENEVRITAFLPAFYTLVAFCALYTLSFLVIWPGRQRYLPHDISTLADLISFLYQSPLLSDKVLREPRSKADLATRLIIAAPGEREHPVYGFGIYRGRDGREHLGIDRLYRPGRPDMLITTATLKSKRASLLSTAL